MRRQQNPPPSKGGSNRARSPVATERRAVVVCEAIRGGISDRCRSPALAAYAAVLLLTSTALAENSPAVKSPVSPQESLQHFAHSPDLRIELVAHEPDVIDPVAIRFDEDGRMWVVEMRDYPTGAAGGNPAASRISVLEDRDGNGFFESSTVFADGLAFATGLQPWRGGVFVTMAGQLAYMKDTNGDGRADLVETWYTGFAEENTQLRANDPRLALDNHIYVANGLRGGKVVDARHPGANPVDISGMDFRFAPLTGKCEAVSGVGQFGMTFDDYSNRFVCTNRNPAIHVVLENRYLKKNPLIAVVAVTHDVAAPAERSRIFPIARSWTTSNLHAGQFTAACGVEIYRGDALPKEYYGNIFTCEPTAHLVHREIMKPKGVTFESMPAEAGREFLASRDPWFSPVNLEIGPDGALYVVDMYRAVIEHPAWMPSELQKRPDLLDGNDRGRIYRVVATSAERSRTRLKLSQASSLEIVELLKEGNSWQRESAARLLLERQEKTTLTPLAVMATGGDSLARIQAHRLIEGLGLTDADFVRSTLDDGDPRVVEQIVMIAEPWAGKPGPLRVAVARLARHADARVRVAALLALAPYVATLSRPADRWEQEAMLVAAGNEGGELLAKLLKDPARLEANVDDARGFVADAARLAAASPSEQQHQQAIAAVLASSQYRQVGLTGFFGELRRRGIDLAAIKSKLSDAQRGQLEQAFAKARATAQNPTSSDAARGEALDLLAGTEDSTPLIAALAANDASQQVRLRAIAALGGLSSLEPWQALVRHFSNETPALQQAILDGLIARNDRTALLLDEIAAGTIKPTALDAARTAALLNHRDAAIKRRAQALLAEAIPADRRQVLEDYGVALTIKGEPTHGREVFAKHCAACHRIANVGENLGPDISDSREKTPLQLLTDIVQPNRAVDANYFSYTALTIDGLAVTGILTAETSTSITLKETAEKMVALRRDEINHFASNGVSLMPEGLEREIPHQDMADLIAFIKNWRYLDGGPPVGGP